MRSDEESERAPIALRTLLATVILCTGSIAGADNTSPPATRAKNLVPHSRKWTLSECIATALTQNPQIRAAMWKSRRASEYVREARGYRLPFVGASSFYKGYDRDQMVYQPHHMPISPSMFNDNIYGYDVSVRFPLFHGLRLSNGVQMAEARARSALAMKEWAEDYVAFTVTAAFYQAAALTKTLDSTLASLRAMESHEKLVEHKVEVGRSARVDLLRMRVRVARLKQQAVRVRSDRDVAVHQLSTLMGIDQSLTSDMMRYELTFHAQQIDEKRCVKEALDNRPDYKAALLAIAAQKKKLAIAQGEHWPTVDLRGDYSGRGSDDVSTDENWYGGVEVRIPLFEGGTIQSRVNQARMELQAIRADARRLELDIRHGVRIAHLHIRKAAESVRATETSIAEAIESLRIEREKYASGRATITDVLDAQASLLDAQTNYFESLADHRVALAELALAMGKTRTPEGTKTDNKNSHTKKSPPPQEHKQSKTTEKRSRMKQQETTGKEMQP